MIPFQEVANKLINEISDSTREADESIVGYYYQIDQTLFDILSGDVNRTYRLEKIEDYVVFYLDNLGQQFIKATQIKYHHNKVTNSIVYKPLLYGYISYLCYKKANSDVNFSVELAIGTETNVEVNCVQSLDSILAYAPFTNSYKKFKSLWESNFLGNPPRLEHNYALKKEYLSRLVLRRGESYHNLINNNIELIKIIHPVPLVSYETYYAYYWNTLRKVLSSESKEITKGRLISLINDIVEEYRFIADKDFQNSEPYNEYTKCKVGALIASCIEQIFEELDVALTHDQGLAEITERYENLIYPMIHKLLFNNFNTREKRQAFLNTLVPSSYIELGNKLDSEIEAFKENKVYIKSLITRLAKLFDFLKIESVEEAEKLLNVNGKLWKLSEIDERGSAIMMSGLTDLPRPQVLLSLVSEKHKLLNDYSDVWYLDNIGIKCDKVLEYQIDITDPKAVPQKIRQDKRRNFYRIECLACLKANEIENQNDCDHIMREKCKYE